MPRIIMSSRLGQFRFDLFPQERGRVELVVSGVTRATWAGGDRLTLVGSASLTNDDLVSLVTRMNYAVNIISLALHKNELLELYVLCYRNGCSLDEHPLWWLMDWINEGWKNGI